NANPGFTGTTTIQDGTVIVQDPGALGNAGAGAISVTTGAQTGFAGTLQLQGSYTFGKTLSLTGRGYNLPPGGQHGALRTAGPGPPLTPTGPITFGTGTTRITNDANTTLTINSQVSGTGSIEKSGTGILVLNGNNTYQGLTSLLQGVTIVGSPTALGGTG